MPYKNGKWIPPAAAEAWGLNDDDTSDEEVLQTLIASGDLQSGQSLGDLFGFSGDKEEWETKSWETDLQDWQRAQILRHYAEQGYYEGGNRELNEGWGIQFEREWGSDGLDDDSFSDYGQWDKYRALIGSGYDIDYSHYNENLAYRSTVEQLGFKDLRTPFTSPRQIAAAEALLRQPSYDWDEAWVKNNAMTYNDQEVEALEDFKKHNPTRHFDPETNITTYMNPQDSRSLSTKLYEARQAGNYNELKEPGSPQFIHVVAGDVPKEKYNSEGTRILADGDVRAMYTRYLGRDHSKLVDVNMNLGTPAHDPDAIGKDEIAYWEKSAIDNNMTYDDVLAHIKGSAEAKQNIDRGPVYYNPNKGKEAEITSKLTAEPAPINPPNLSIRKVTLKRPTNIPSTWKVPGL